MSITTKKRPKSAAADLPEDVTAAIAEIDREAKERMYQLRKAEKAKQHEAHLKKVAIPLDRVVDQLRRNIRQRVHRSSRGICFGVIESLHMDVRPSEGERYYLKKAQAIVLAEIGTGTFMNMPSVDLGHGHYLVAARMNVGFPSNLQPIEGMNSNEVQRLWRHVVDGRPGCWTISDRPAYVTDRAAVAKSLLSIVETGLLEVVDADGLLLVSAGPLLR